MSTKRKVQRPQKPQLTGAARDLLKNEVATTKSLQKRLLAQLNAEATRELNNGETQLGAELNRAHRAQQSAVLSGVVRIAQGVVASFGLNVPIKASMSHTRVVSAWTDFAEINIKVPTTTVTWDKDGNAGLTRARDYGNTPPTSAKTFTAEVLGLIYHELGHCRFTLPFLDMAAAAGQPPVEDRDLTYHRAWNILEDQRMEAAVVNDSPVIANYFAVMMLSNSATVWELVAGRTYLDHIDPMIRSEARKTCEQADAFQDCIWAYMAAETPLDLWEQVEVMRNLLISSQSEAESKTSHVDKKLPGSNSERQKRSERRSEAGAISPEEIDQGPGDSKGDSKGGSKVDSKGDSDGSDDNDDNDDNPAPLVGAGGADEKDNDSETPRPRSATEIIEDIVNNSEVSELLQTKAEELTDTTNEHGYEPNDQVTHLDGDDVSRAEALSQDLVGALSQATAHMAPEWSYKTRTGYIDPVRYRARQAGDMEFRRDYSGTDNPSTNVSISLVLDISGSMEYSVQELGVMAYASALACKTLSIDLRVVTFDYCAEMLYTDKTATPIFPKARGGTNPTNAFNMVKSFEISEGSQHLVIVMTDGEFDKYKPVYFNDQTSVIGLGFSHGSPDGADWCTQRLVQNGIENSKPITDLAQIPTEIENFLLDLIQQS